MMVALSSASFFQNVYFLHKYLMNMLMSSKPQVKLCPQKPLSDTTNTWSL